MENFDSQLQTIFAHALEIGDPVEQAAFLARACGTNTDLRRNLEELIKAETEAGEFLPDQPRVGAAEGHLFKAAGAGSLQARPSQAPITEKPGDRIGNYRLLQQIGEGGCGVVYMANQEEPVRRRVALKVIKPGMDSKQVLGRFEAERQALALMEHPNIAKVFDAGATEAGRPYFVMELVKGIPITRYCDENKLDTPQRLTLFIQVCQAVQHAHQKGIIHRDIKPSNVLVADHDGKPVPKVIDFGIAKAATDQPLTDKTIFTAFEQFIGTPAYMSPEQAKLSGLDIDTRSDIYSLGVLLYELLTGKTPFDAKRLLKAGFDEIRRIIREEEPLRPSTRLSNLEAEEQTTVAKDRHSEAPKLRGLLRGDLDWIVMKTLEKDRNRRYETANGLASDIQRHLNNEVVVARPPSTLYRFQRVVRRNKLAFSAGLAIAVALLAGTAATAWQAVRAGNEKQRFQRNVVRQYVANGTRLMNEGDLFASLLWYTEALRLDAGDARREEPHRIRIASVLRQSPKLLNVFSHGTMLYHAEFSPDGSKVVTASDDHTARVWDAATGVQLLELHHDGDVYDATFSRDGLRIVTSSQDKTARLWDSRTGALLRKLPHSATVWRSGFSPDAKRLATASEDHTVHLWDGLTGTPVAAPLQHSHRVDHLSFSPDGHFLFAIETADGTACLWDVASTPRLIREFAHNGNYADVPFSPDGLRFLTCDGSNLRVWELNALQEIPFSPLKQAGDIECLGFSPDGHTIIAGCSDGITRFWDADSGRQLIVPVGQQTTDVNAVHFSPDGRRVVIAGSDGIARFWNARTGQPVSPPLKHIMYVKSALISSDGRRLLANSCDQAARVWDMATSDLPGPRRPVFENEQRSLSPNGQYQLSKRESNVVWVTEAKSGRRLAALSHTNEVIYSSFSRDGRSVITACMENCAVSEKRTDVFLWEVPGGRRLNQASMAISFDLMYVAFSPDNRRLLTCGFDYNARLWDAHTGEPLSDPLRHRERVPWGAFSPDGRSVVTVSRDKSARIWDAANGKPLTPPLLHRATPTGAFWSPDGKRLNTVTDDDHLQVWDLASGEPLTPPRWISEDDPPAAPTSSTSAQANEDLPRDSRSVADLVRLSQMLALGRIDPDGSVVPLHLPELTSAWHFLREKYPEQFAATPAEVAEWHQEDERAKISDQLNQAIALSNDDKYRADIHARSGRWEEAAVYLARAVETNPSDHLLWHSLAPLLVQSGQLEAYREHCRRSLERFGKTTDPCTADRIAKDCLILAGSGANLDTVATMADTAVAEGQHSDFQQFLSYFQFCKGLADYRQGRFASAADWMGTVLANHEEALDLQTEAYMVLAMSRSQSHQVDQARAALAKGTELEQELPKLDSGDIGASWVDWIIAHALMKEAKALIGAQPVPEQNAPARLQ